MAFNIGDSIISERRGKGKVLRIDPTDKDFKYLCRFKDGTLAWIGEKEVSEFEIVTQ